jgi:hypothetical protein
MQHRADRWLCAVHLWPSRTAEGEAMKVVTLLRILLLFFVAGLMYINVLQGTTIATQRTIIRQMAQNPQCFVPEEKP